MKAREASQLIIGQLVEFSDGRIARVQKQDTINRQVYLEIISHGDFVKVLTPFAIPIQPIQERWHGPPQANMTSGLEIGILSWVDTINLEKLET